MGVCLLDMILPSALLILTLAASIARASLTTRFDALASQSSTPCFTVAAMCKEFNSVPRLCNVFRRVPIQHLWHLHLL